MASLLLGLLDPGYYALRNTFSREHKKFFKNGYGDLARAEEHMRTCMGLLRDLGVEERMVIQGPVNASDAIGNSWYNNESSNDGAASNISAVSTQTLRFRSPFRTVCGDCALPREAWDAEVMLVEPRRADADSKQTRECSCVFNQLWEQNNSSNANDSTAKTPSSSMPPTCPGSVGTPRVFVVLFPATGEETTDDRRALADLLATERGFSSLIITAPLYGRRRAQSQGDTYHADNLADFLSQSTAIIMEGVAIARHMVVGRQAATDNAGHESERAIVCYSGFSWGAAMASAAAVASLAWMQDVSCPAVEICAAPYAGSATPAVVADGLLAGDIEWKALVKQDDQEMSTTSEDDCSTEQEKVDRAKRKVRNTLLSAHLSRFSGALGVECLSRLRAVECVSFADDHFVKQEYCQELFEILRSWASDPNAAHITWMSGGHVRAALSRLSEQRGAIERAVARTVESAGRDRRSTAAGSEKDRGAS